MAVLYIGPKGIPWRKHSYSAGTTFDQSPLKYFLQKVQGWREKDNKASFLFGRALEQSIEFYHDHNGFGGVEDFQTRWAIHRETPGLTYTKVEKDWENLLWVGTDMMRLYAVRQPSLPIPLGGGSVFQREYGKEVFPGDPNYGEIEDAGKLDIVCYVDPACNLLPKINWEPEYGRLRPLIVDIKTSAKDFPENPGIAAFDKQLRRYSWLSGIRDVAMLWFTKKSRGFRKGSKVTFLESTGLYNAGEEAVVEKVDDENLWIVRNNYGLRVHSSFVTKQRLQFNCGFVTIESAEGAGEIAGRQIVQIVNSWKKYAATRDVNKSFPSTFGIRFPNDDRNDPYFRAFLLKDEAFLKDHFRKVEEETLDDLFGEPEEEIEE